jgi:uncharacterized protein YuzE
MPNAGLRPPSTQADSLGLIPEHWRNRRFRSEPVLRPPVRFDHFPERGVVHDLVDRQRRIGRASEVSAWTVDLVKRDPTDLPVSASHGWEALQRRWDRNLSDWRNDLLAYRLDKWEADRPPPLADLTGLLGRRLQVEGRLSHPDERSRVWPLMREQSDEEANLCRHRKRETRHRSLSHERNLTLRRHSGALAQLTAPTPDTLSRPVRVTYDPEVDAAYVYLREPEARKGTVTSLPVEGAPGVIVLDFDTDGCLFGVEVLDASKLLPSELLEAAERR